MQRKRAQRWAALLGVPLLACAAEGPRPETRHADLDAFLAADAAAAERRVVLIGIDGASWEYLRPLLDAGELPALARIVRDGASGRLRSIECHFTPPAWTTMLTGVLPERHGIYSFGSWHAEKRRFAKVTSNEVVAPAVWDVASRAGRQVAVVGMPATYPPHPVNGVMVSGIMTPKTRIGPIQLTRAPERIGAADPSLVSHSPVLTAAFEDANNVVLPTFVDTSDDGVAGYDEVRLRVLRKGLGSPQRRTLADERFPVGRFSPWLRVRLSNERPVREGFVKLRFDPPSAAGVSYLLTPTFLRIRHPFAHPPGLARKLVRRFGYYLPHEFLSGEILESVAEEAAGHARYFLHETPWDLYLYLFGQSDNAHHLVGFADEVLPIYRIIDGFLSEVVDSLDADTTLVIASDHGFGEFDHSVDLNQFLASLDLLAWKVEGEIDHERTLVFHNMWHLHFDRQLLTAEALTQRGIEPAEGESLEDALARHLAAAARDLRGPGGRRFPVELVRLPEGAAGHAPDMAVLAASDFWVEFWNVDRPSPDVVRPLEGYERWKHARDGVLAVYGAGVAPGRDLGTVDIQDVAPTVLDLLGLPVADDLDGEAIALLRPEVAAARPLQRVPSFAALRRETVDAPDDPSSFEDTLRALGYVRD